MSKWYIKEIYFKAFSEIKKRYGPFKTKEEAISQGLLICQESQDFKDKFKERGSAINNWLYWETVEMFKK